MILSVSRRTDVPALYAEWFRNRLDAGFADVPNPYNARQVSRISLRPEDVDAFVFWTRFPRPCFDEVLPRLEARGDRALWQVTVTGYGKPVEARTPPLGVAIAALRALAARVRKGSVVWRYDPILVGDAFPAAEHVERFARIASRLEGAVERVVVSVVDPYHKTKRRLRSSFRWGSDLADPPERWPGLDDLLRRLAEVARDHGLAIEACAEERDLAPLGIPPTRCVDDRLLRRLYGGTWTSSKDPGQRPACRCVRSRDLGVPDTCTFGCAYCYATRSDELARRRREAHDPRGAALIPDGSGVRG